MIAIPKLLTKKGQDATDKNYFVGGTVERLRSERKDGTFNRSDFTFDAENNRYICPAGRFLKTAWRSKQKNPYRYRASQLDCQSCPLKAQCCPNMTQRNIDRSPHESARDVARAIAKTDTYKQSSKERKKVEMLFAHLKRIL